MSEQLDKQLAEIKAEADAKAAAIVAEAKAKDNAATFTEGLISDGELSATVEAYKTEIGKSAPHSAVGHLFTLVKHLFAKVNAAADAPAPIEPAG